MTTSVKSPPDNNRLLVLDAMRGLCALLVAMHHFKASGLLVQNSFIANAFLFVDFFFVLSGFVIARTYQKRLNSAELVKTYLIRRFARLYPLYILSLVPFILIELFVIPMFPQSRDPFVFPVDLESLVLTTLLLNSVGLTDGLTWNYPSWSISGEIFAYTWFALIIITSGRFWLWALSVVSLVSYVILINYSQRFIDVTHELGAIRCAAGFSIGAILWAVYKKLTESDATARAIKGLTFKSSTVLECLALVATVLFVIFAGQNAYSFLAPFLFAVVIIVFAQEKGLCSKALSNRVCINLGAWSYSIYMVHAFWASRVYSGGLQIAESLGFELLNPETRLFGATALQGSILTLSYIGAVVLTAWLSYKLVELPAQRFILKKVKNVPAKTDTPNS